MTICGAYPPAIMLARSSLSSAFATAAPIAKVACSSTCLSSIAGLACYSRRRPSETLLRSRACCLPLERRRKGRSGDLSMTLGDGGNGNEGPRHTALNAELDLPHDCKLRVYMTCSAKMEKGEVDQSGAMLSKGVIEQGHPLMSVSYLLSNCKVRTIPKEELLKKRLATADD